MSGSSISVIASVPYHRAGPYVVRAIESLLTQTHRDLIVVVVNDGDTDSPWSLLAHLEDPRLVRFDLPACHGRYFVDAVVLRATTTPYFLVQDADDWSDPTRVETLLLEIRRQHAAGAISARRLDGNRGSAAVQSWPLLGTPLHEQMQHRATQQGLFRVDALRRIGGFHAGFRLGYDTLLVNLLEMVGRVVAVEAPLYHVTVRAGSLTTSPKTGWGSQERATLLRRLERLYGYALRSYREYLAGAVDAEELASAIERLVYGSLPPADLEALRTETARLRAILRASETATLAPPEPSATRPQRHASPWVTPHAVVTHEPPLRIYDFLAQGDAPFVGWAIGPTLAVELAEHLDRTRPERILEIGSGASTVVLAAHADARGAAVTVVEHDRTWLERTRQQLMPLGLAAQVDLRLSPLQPYRCPDGQLRPWYDADLSGPFDFVLVDAPPAAEGRGAALFALAPLLSPTGEVWLHDANRDHEQACMELWRGWLPFSCVVRNLDGRGVAMLRRDGDAALRTRPPAIPAGLAVTLLTGGRPRIVEQTIETLVDASPDLLRKSYVIVLVNGDDSETDSFVRSLPFVDRLLHHRGKRLPIGAATSRLVAQAVGVPGLTHLLHLEDDWAVCTLDATWLIRAFAILNDQSDVGQVRLRHRGDRVLRRHMVTGRPISWESCDGMVVSRSAHFTFNPSLLRLVDLPMVFPVSDELAAQQRFLRSGMWSAQLTPGVFRHIG